MKGLTQRLILKISIAGIIGMAILFAFPVKSMALERYQIIMLGDNDQYVTQLQTALHEKGYLKQKPTGYYGTDTQNAVMAFQRANKLSVDGKTGPTTLQAILGKKYKPLPNTRKVKNDQNASPDTYGPGDKGDKLKDYQKILKNLEYYTYSKITGYYGPMTEIAVKRFQRTNELKVDGVLGEETIKLLGSGNAKYYTIYPGDKSDDVKKLQTRLKELGYYREKDITGYYGNKTEAAVEKFQKINNLTADGKAGKNTRKAIFDKNAKKNSGSSTITNIPRKSSQTKTQSMLAFAKAQLGKRYVRGREGPDCFDCSGFVYYVITNKGVETTRYSADAFSKVSSWTKITKMSSLKPGDILFWKNGSNSSRIGHTGIYLGGGKFIHAAFSKGKVVISDLKGYFIRNFAVARRVF